MQDPVRVKARFNGPIAFQADTKAFRGYQFTIVAPPELRDQRVQFEALWAPHVFSRLIIGEEYLVTVPKYQIGTNELICAWSLTYKGGEKQAANHAIEGTAK